jgi:hypothetical protein
MPIIEIVENPKRRRKSRKRRPKTTKRRTIRRRRNPVVATLSNPRRRRRTVKRRTYRKRRNPKFGLGGLINLQGAGAVAAGFITARMAPNLISKVWPGVPTTGPLSYLVRAGATILVAYGIKTLTRKTDLAKALATGGLGYILYDVANTYLLPKIGLSGLADDGPYMTMSELDRIGVSGYEHDYSGAFAGYIPDSGVSGYTDITDDALAA